ncbi:magnesium transporter MgtE N-terminal domain-containing protein [Jannaschia sp. R86511]|uniref:magnesium transporter MgtE N-terminal domain-containing protein n=1 Tax=Jannaschia sp. R86511 TaxID=3093853 RepID=UPI0036D330A6
MSTSPTRVFAARLAGLAVFDPSGDQVGRVRDVVVVLGATRARAVGLVVEVPGRRRVFLPLTRVTSMEATQVITTGLVNMRRFEQRAAETLVLAELLDRQLDLTDGSGAVSIEDVGFEQSRGHDWVVTRLFVRRVRPNRGGSRLRRRGESFLVELDEVSSLVTQGTGPQGAASLLAAFDELKAADLAEVLHAMAPKRRREVAAALDDEKLADVLEELPEDDQIEIVTGLKSERAADVLEAMEPDDAADLLSDLDEETAAKLLAIMEPEEAAQVRRLLAYDEDTAGGIMTSEPVVLPPEATVAEALAMVRRAELAPAMAAAVFVCRPPLEAPTGRFLGVVHVQRLLREPPQSQLGNAVDRALEPLPTDAKLLSISRHLATYNLVSAPVVDASGRLVGVVTVDDVLDHLLPDDWREQEDPAEVVRSFARRRAAALASTTAEGLVGRRRPEDRPDGAGRAGGAGRSDGGTGGRSGG